jgi:hypothetical protein
MKHKLSFYFRKYHRWLSIIIGIQVLLWTLSGLVMSYLPIDEVRGRHLAKKETGLKIKKDQDLLPLSQVVNQYPEAMSIELVCLGEFTAFRVRSDSKKILLHAKTGEVLSPLNKQRAQSAANSYLIEPQPAQSLEYIEDNPPIEYRGELPVWQVNYQHPEAVSLYLSPHTGELLSVRTTRWRIFDFFWMLHIMDYKNRNHFNSLLLVVSSSLTLLMSLLGFLLLLSSMNRKRV